VASKTSSDRQTEEYAKARISGFDEKKFFDRAMAIAKEHKFSKLFPSTD
jgi:hypothetical protein